MIKVRELRALPIQELEQKLKDSKSDFFKKKFQHASHPLANPMEIRILRKTIARLITLIKEKKSQK